MTMTATGTMATVTDAALLQLIWLASPALPIGGFSYSEGVESAIDAQLVTDEESAAQGLRNSEAVSTALPTTAPPANWIESPPTSRTSPAAPLTTPSPAPLAPTSLPVALALTPSQVVQAPTRSLEDQGLTRSRTPITSPM